MTDMRELIELARGVVALAQRRGADEAECVIQHGCEFSATVRLGEVEALKEAGGKGLGVRVFAGRKSASAFSSDLSEAALARTVDSALAMARASTDDAIAGLPEEFAAAPNGAAELGIYFPGTAAIAPEAGIALARECEAAALAADPRIQNSEGGGFEASESHRVLANSRGFAGGWSRSGCSLSAVPIAAQDGQMQRDYWYAVAHRREALEAPDAVGRIAAARAVRRLGARKPPTGQYPVIFEPQAARSILGHIAESVNGDMIYRQSSFLAGKIGQAIAHPSVTVVDDGRKPGGFASRPYDGEGVATRRTVVIEKGVLQSYLLNTYAARKLGLRSTGNASRGLAGAPGISSSNLYLEPGATPAAAIIQSVKQGLYVTELIGFGFNAVNGDYSRGAAGLWIENGEFAYPVEELTIAGNLSQMLLQISAIGSDLEFRGSVASPTLLFENLTIAGQ